MPNQIFANPYPFNGRDNTAKSMILNGSVQLFGLYPAGGEALNWTSIISGFSGNEVSPMGMAPSLASGSALVTTLAAASGTITATAANNFAVGFKVTFVGCVTQLGLLLNGLTFTVVTASATQFTFASTLVGTGTSETGIAATVEPAVLIPGSGLTQQLTATVTAVAAASGVVTVTAANNYLPGATVTFSAGSGGLALALNGLTFTVIASTGAAFTIASALTGASGTGSVTGRNANQPYSASFWSTKGSGYSYVFDSTLGKLHAMVSGAVVSLPNADIAAGAYPAAVLADIVRFEANFVQG